MKTRFTKEYREARYELAYVGADEKPLRLPSAPWRFDRVLTEAEMLDGVENGFQKYAVKMFETVEDDAQEHEKTS